MKKFKLYDVFTAEGFYLTQGYGRNASYYKKFGLLWHEGIDLGDKTDPRPIVRAAHDGVVVRDEDIPRGNYGNYVVLWDDKQLCATWYCHLKENFVKVGQRVKAGDPIGIMGATGNVTGKHLHFGFVLTDKNGIRLYKNKKQNFGFLDPQFHKDPSPPIYPPGVEKYQVEWLPWKEEEKGESITVDKKLYEKLVWKATSRDEVWKKLNLDLEYDDWKKAIKKIEELEGKIAELGKLYAKANAEIGNRKEQISRLNEELSKEKELRLKLTEQLEEMRKNNESSLKKMIEEYEKEKERLQGTIEKLAKEKGNLLKENEALKKEVEDLQKLLKEARKAKNIDLTLEELVIMLIEKLLKFRK